MKKIGLIFLAMVMLCACQKSENAPVKQTESSNLASPKPAQPANPQLDKGVGPIQVVKLEPIDKKLAKSGKHIFEAKCMACHKLNKRFSGPPLGGITSQKTPEYIMNFILNPEGMTKDNPSGQALLEQYLTAMPNLKLKPADARAVLEYLRTTKQITGQQK